MCVCVGVFVACFFPFCLATQRDGFKAEFQLLYFLTSLLFFKKTLLVQTSRQSPL